MRKYHGTVARYRNIIVFPSPLNPPAVDDWDPYPLGRFGQCHGIYLQHCDSQTWNELTEEGHLEDYLEFVDKMAESELNLLVDQMMLDEDLDEYYQEEHPEEYEYRVKSIRQRAEEEINRSLIYC